MSKYKLLDVHLKDYGNPLIPVLYWDAVPLTPNGEKTVYETREAIKAILDGRDTRNRKIVVVGPCSVHEEESVKELVHKIEPRVKKHNDKLVYVIRQCYEKPRTRGTSWRGFIVDPNLNGKVNYHEGYTRARQLLAYTVDLGVPVATEFIDKDTPQIIGDAISWAWIGARSVETNEYRGMVSGLSMPTGIKNSTSGNIMKAIDAIITAMHPDTFHALHPLGLTCPTPTDGNPHAHLVLRGGEDKGPNYEKENVEEAQRMLIKEGLKPNVLVDCSHDNTRNQDGEKKYEWQLIVGENVVRQMRDGNNNIIGIMIEAHLQGGSVKPEVLKSPDFDPKKFYGVSRTDPCISLDDAVRFLDEMYRSI